MRHEFPGTSGDLICPACHDPKGWFYARQVKEIPVDQRMSEVSVFREITLMCLGCETLAHLRFYGSEEDCRIYLELS